MSHYLESWLTLSLAQGLTDARAFRLLEQFVNIEALLNASVSTLKTFGLDEKTIHAINEPNQALINMALEWQDSSDQYILPWTDERYPELLRHIHDPPLLIYVKGNPYWLNSQQIAVVGSRNPTHAGRETAIQFSYELALQGITITSGMALGIDGASHQGALAAKKPTIAVLGCGLLHIYPKSHTTLAAEIAEHGALVSEFALTQSPMRPLFPRRNRIISGLSLGTLVVEAALRSGSLITAYLALEQGRDVFAVPGSIFNPLSQGCHKIIQSGAKLVTSSTEILQELPSFDVSIVEKDCNQPKIANHCPDSSLLSCIDFAPTDFEQIVHRSGLTSSEVGSRLFQLELKGYISRQSGKYRRMKS